ncbi:MAG: methyltransferase domain-containing protein [Pseudomonadota bacterium]
MQDGTPKTGASAPRILADERDVASRRDRAQRQGFAGHGDFLYSLVAEQVGERLADVTRRFEQPVLIGSGGGVIAEVVAPITGPIRVIERAPARAAAAGVNPASTLDPLPLEPESADLIISALELHWANDLVGQLIQMRRALKPDGLLIAALFGGETLAELRASLAEAEVAVTGGLSPRIAPMAELRDLGALLQRAGFAMPVADSERVRTSYPDVRSLMRDLRAMGETNAMADRRRVFLRRDVLAATEAVYATSFPAEAGRISSTFDIVFLTGWAPAPNQPQPLRPGSAKIRLADALGTTETSAGEPAGPKKG